MRYLLLALCLAVPAHALDENYEASPTFVYAWDGVYKHEGQIKRSREYSVDDEIRVVFDYNSIFRERIVVAGTTCAYDVAGPKTGQISAAKTNGLKISLRKRTARASVPLSASGGMYIFTDAKEFKDYVAERQISMTTVNGTSVRANDWSVSDAGCVEFSF